MNESRKPTVPEVIDQFLAYSERNPEWGSLHVVMADGNYHDDFVRTSIEDARRKGDTEVEDLARILLSMSKTQRRKIAAICDSAQVDAL